MKLKQQSRVDEALLRRAAEALGPFTQSLSPGLYMGPEFRERARSVRDAILERLGEKV